MIKSSVPELTPHEKELVAKGILPERFKGWLTLEELKVGTPGK